MSMYDSAERLKKEFAELFPDRLTYRQLWWITKLAKGVRLYCRSNVAFNNYFNQVFAGIAKFEQITKTKPGGETYPGLKITLRNKDGTEISDNGGDEE